MPSNCLPPPCGLPAALVPGARSRTSRGARDRSSPVPAAPRGWGWASAQDVDSGRDMRWGRERQVASVARVRARSSALGRPGHGHPAGPVMGITRLGAAAGAASGSTGLPAPGSPGRWTSRELAIQPLRGARRKDVESLVLHPCCTRRMLSGLLDDAAALQGPLRWPARVWTLPYSSRLSRATTTWSRGSRRATRQRSQHGRRYASADRRRVSRQSRPAAVAEL